MEEEDKVLGEKERRRREGKIERHKDVEAGRGRDGGNDYEWKHLSLNQDMGSHK